LVEDDERSFYGIWEQFDECAMASKITIDTFAKWFYDHRTEVVEEEDMIEHFREYFNDEHLHEMYFKIDGMKEGKSFDQVKEEYKPCSESDVEPESSSEADDDEDSTKKRSIEDLGGDSQNFLSKKTKTF
jgi:hypothetical protein